MTSTSPRPSSLRRRLAGAVAGLTAAVLVLTGCSSSGSSASGDRLVKLRVGAPATAVSGLTPALSGPAGWALAKGKGQKILAKYGFEYAGFAGFNNGPPAAQALTSGSIQLAAIGDAPAVLSRSAGQPNRALQVVASPGGVWIAARKGGPTSIQDLKGKKVGVQFGSNFDRYLREVLGEAGLTKQVTLVNLLMGDGYAALSKGAIDAYSATSSLAATWQQKGGVTIIDKAEVSHPDYKMVGITLVNGAFLKQHPDVQKAWWAVYDEGQQLIKQDPDAYLKWTAKQTGLTFDVAKATTSLTDQDAPVTPDSLAAAAGTQKFLKDQKLTKQDFSLADWAVQPDTKGGK